MSDRQDADLETVAADLSETLDALREELERERRDSPGVVDLLRFTERYTIPAVIAVLEANVRMLELLAGSIRVATGDQSADASGRPGATAAATATLDALDGALREASRALSDGEPSDPEARQLLREARELRRELEERLDEQDREGESGDDAEAGPVSVDVESELDTIREEVDEERRAGDRFDEDADGGP